MNPSLKILFISIFMEGDGGGEGRVAYEMARWFSRTHPVVMLCPGETTRLVEDPDGFRRFEVQAVRQGNLSMPLLSGIHVHRIFKFLDEFHPDVIHIHDPALLGVMGQLWAKLNRVPVFYTAHILPSRALDFGAGEVSPLKIGPISEAVAEQYLLDFYSNCDAVVGLNQTAVEEVRNFGYSGRIFMIPNGRNLGMFQSCAFANPAAEVKELLFTGFLSKRKNQAFLLEVMRCLPAGYHLTLIGEPLVADYLDELKRVVDSHHLQVTFAGQCSQEQIVQHLEKTHVFVSASKMEVQSLVVIEALASGTPVVGLSNETVDELVDGSTGCRLPKDASPQEFAGVVQHICELPAPAYQQMCEACRSRVQELDWEKIMQRTVECYQGVLTEMSGIETETTPLMELVAGIHDERLRDEINGIISRLTLQPGVTPVQQATAIWLAWLNMTASVAGYYWLKIPASTSLREIPYRRRRKKG